MYYREKCARPVCVAGEAAKSGTVYSWFMSSEDTAANFGLYVLRSEVME